MYKTIKHPEYYKPGGKYEYEKPFSLRINRELYSRILAEANINHRSINAQIIVMLEYQINLVDKQLAKLNNK